jgi:group I intron endonuclease
MQNEKYLVYKISNNINGKIYIGRTGLSIEARFLRHERKAKYGKITKLYNAIRKYGIHNFEISILHENLSYLESQKNEILEIINYNSINSGYNIAIGGQGNLLNSKLSIHGDKILQLINEGLHVEEIARRLNENRWNIKRFVINNRLVVNKIKGSIPKLSEIDKTNIIKLADGGYTVPMIVKHLSLPKHPVTHFLKKQGIKPKNGRQMTSEDKELLYQKLFYNRL